MRPGALGLAVDEAPPAGPQLYMATRGTASIRDDSQPLRSKRYIATMTLQAEGWILDVNAGGTFGPFSFAEEAFEWWVDHRDALPESTWRPWRTGSWPPGIDEDWSGNDE
ncbi:hypothetical protein C5B94_04065 [Clavibacter michiganensis]|nr:hypothetical protein C5B94_04065 [Clavibacter michiganensis]